MHPWIAVDLARWISPKFAVYMTVFVQRYLSGDITLVNDVLKQHDATHGTTSTASVTTVEKGIDRVISPRIELEMKAKELEIALEAERATHTMCMMEHEKAMAKWSKDISELQRRFEEEVGRETRFAVGCALRRRGISDDIPSLERDRAPVPSADKRRIYLSTFALQHGMKLDRVERCDFGTVCSDTFRAKHGIIPGKEPRKVDGVTKDINVYTDTDMKTIEEAWEAYLKERNKKKITSS